MDAHTDVCRRLQFMEPPRLHNDGTPQIEQETLQLAVPARQRQARWVRDITTLCPVSLDYPRRLKHLIQGGQQFLLCSRSPRLLHPCNDRINNIPNGLICELRPGFGSHHLEREHIHRERPHFLD